MIHLLNGRKKRFISITTSGLRCEKRATLIGYSGLKAENLNRDHLNEDLKLQPGLTFIMIGGNDVSFYEKNRS